MKAATLALLASCVTVCSAQETGTNNAILISVLVFAILGCLAASIALGFVIYRGRKPGKPYKPVPEDEEEGTTSVNGGYGSHGHHLYAGSDGRSAYYGQKTWYYNPHSDEYEWGYILIGGFCCIVVTVGLGVFIWWAVVHA
jgi:hypothetical protein